MKNHINVNNKTTYRSLLKIVISSFLLTFGLACHANSAATDPAPQVKPNNPAGVSAAETNTSQSNPAKPGGNKAAAKKPAPVVVFETTMGNIEIALNPEKAPVTVQNFLSYVRSKHYDGTIFHRIIPYFMAQGGGYTEELARKATKEPIINESSNGLPNARGTISMARLGTPDSATAQFFINYVDNANLNWAPGRSGYTVFGKVVKGMEVVDAMAEQPQGDLGGPFINAPATPIIINKAYVK